MIRTIKLAAGRGVCLKDISRMTAPVRFYACRERLNPKADVNQGLDPVKSSHSTRFKIRVDSVRLDPLFSFYSLTRRPACIGCTDKTSSIQDILLNISSYRLLRRMRR